MAAQFQAAQQGAPQVSGLDLNQLLGLINQLQQSQSAQPDVNPLMAQAYGSYLGFPGQMQNAMGQMYQVNQGNQQAKLFNNNLNAQLGQAGMLAGSNILQALYGAQAQLGVADLQRRAQTDMFSNPLFQEYIRGNLGTSVADAQGRNALAQINAKGQIAKDLFGSMSGILGGAFGGVGGGAAGILQGFQSADGSQSAQLPGRAAAPASFSPASPAAQPAATQQEQPGAMQPYLQQISARGGVNPQPWRQYIADYMAQRRL